MPNSVNPVAKLSQRFDAMGTISKHAVNREFFEHPALLTQFKIEAPCYCMLASYMDGAMELARYEVMKEEGLYWGEVPPCPGVWARGHTLPGCQRQLREALSDWIALRLRKGLDLPVIAGIDLNQIGLASNA